MTNGRGESRFPRSSGPAKPINISAGCCWTASAACCAPRCTQFSEQIAGDPFIALIERGALQQVGIYEKEPFELLLRQHHPDLPGGCADQRGVPVPVPAVRPGLGSVGGGARLLGAAIRVDHRRGKVMRRLAGDDPQVNEEWISDKDRFAFNYATTGDQLTHR